MVSKLGYNNLFRGRFYQPTSIGVKGNPFTNYHGHASTKHEGTMGSHGTWMVFLLSGSASPFPSAAGTIDTQHWWILSHFQSRQR